MIYLAMQTLFWIVPAVVLGIFIGWLIWQRASKNARIELENLRRTVSNRDKKIASLRGDFDQCRAMLKVYKKEMAEACRPGLVPPLPASVPRAQACDADDLKKISGVRPFLEGKLNALNIYTFEQVAALSPEVIEELGTTMESLSDRIIQEDWVGQAKKLYAAKTGANPDA
jgi:predicted flap endonuclease-1-like 5' DNA nuclease